MTENSNECSTTYDKPDWFGDYAPGEHVNDVIKGVAFGGEKRVEDVSAARTREGDIIVDADTVSGDTVRLVYDAEDLSKLRGLIAELVGDGDE